MHSQLFANCLGFAPPRKAGRFPSGDRLGKEKSPPAPGISDRNGGQEGGEGLHMVGGLVSCLLKSSIWTVFNFVCFWPKDSFRLSVFQFFLFLSWGLLGFSPLAFGFSNVGLLDGWIVGLSDWNWDWGPPEEVQAARSGLLWWETFRVGPGLKSCECGNNKSRPLLVGKHHHRGGDDDDDDYDDDHNRATTHSCTQVPLPPSFLLIFPPPPPSPPLLFLLFFRFFVLPNDKD